MGQSTLGRSCRSSQEIQSQTTHEDEFFQILSETKDKRRGRLPTERLFQGNLTHAEMQLLSRRSFLGPRDLVCKVLLEVQTLFYQKPWE